MNNINKQLIATQMPGIRPQNVRSGMIQNSIPLLPFQTTNAVKTTSTLGNLVTATNNTGTSYFLLPSSAVPGQGMVATAGNVTNTTIASSGQKGIAQLISTNQITPNKGKIMLLTTAPGQIKNGQIGQTMNFNPSSSQNKTTIATPNQPKILTGLTPSGSGQAFQFFTTLAGNSFTQNKFPLQVTSTASSVNNKAPTATQIVTVIDNQNGQLQIRPAGPSPATKSETITTKIVSSPSPVEVEEPVELNSEEIRKLLEANEELESSGSSTDTSMELVPGISNFCETKNNGISYFEQKEIEEYNSTVQQAEEQSSNDNSNIKKMTCSFGFTEYGVTSVTKPVFLKGTKRPYKEDNEESKTQTPSKSITMTSSSSIVTKPSTSFSSVSSNTLNTLHSKKPLNSDKNAPQWQRGLTNDEITNIKAFASLSTAVLLKKLKDIHNTAFHLAIEEEKEMLKARFLNILDNHTETNINGHSCNLGTHDFAYSESKLCQPSESTSR